MNTKQNNGILNQFMKSEPALFSALKLGDLTEGVVLEKKAGMLLVDLGKFGTGAVYRSEIQNAKELVKGLKIGDPIHGKVVNIDNEEGLVELSLMEAGRQKVWAEVAELKEKEEIIDVKPTAFNRGGLIVQVNGLQAFLPVSQLSTEHYPKVSLEDKTQIAVELQKLVGQEFKVKIIDVNPRNNKFIISEKAAQEESVKELSKNYVVGQIVEGIVSGVADFGAFLKFTDNPAVEGLIHVSELDWRLVENPKEIVNVDDVLRAKIIEIKDGKISLSLKSLKPDPWASVGEKYESGAEVLGRVYSFNPFGAVVNLDNQIQGQLHVSEFGGVLEMKQKIALGKEYPLIIESVDPKERRIVLKLKK